MTTTSGDDTLESAGDTFQTSFGLPDGDVRGLGLKESCEKRSEGEVGYLIDPREFYNEQKLSSTSKIMCQEHDAIKKPCGMRRPCHPK
jgi:hypothetical protein